MLNWARVSGSTIGGWHDRAQKHSAAAAAILISTKALRAAGSALALLNCERVGPGTATSIATRLQWGMRRAYIATRIAPGDVAERLKAAVC